MYKNIIKFPNAFSYLVYKRTYARRLNDYNNKTEEFKDTIDRIINGCKNQLKLNLNIDDEYTFRNNMYNFNCSVAGRFLWQLGSRGCDNSFGSLMNCMYINIDNHKNIPKIFNWLMLGTGVGFGVQQYHIKNVLPILDKEINIKNNNDSNDVYFVKDSREGWVELLDKILDSYFVSGASFEYSTKLIRPAGVPLKIFGGVSSGDSELIKGMSNIINILDNNRGKKLRDIDFVDIITNIASIVVSGNVRRSALISIGDPTETYLIAKKWSLGNIPNCRAYVNMTVEVNDINDIIDNELFWDTYRDGEAFGFFNKKNCREFGRIGDTKYKDNTDGMNPCGEMTLENNEVCNLSEIYLEKFKNYDDLLKISKILYRICKHAYLLPCHDKETEKICQKNMRIGLGITGYLESTEEQKRWLPKLYNDLRQYDIEYVNMYNELNNDNKWQPSIKLTTIKPSGSLSSLLGTLCYGIHPAFDKYIIRRMRISTNHELVNICKKSGYKVYYEERFDGTYDEKTSIIEFYIKANDKAIIAKDMTAIDQLETVKRLQIDWSDNSVSCSIYYTLEELPKIREYLKNNYNLSFKSLSFLLKYDHGFKNAPLESITKEQYEEYIKNIKDVDLSMIGEMSEDELYNNNIECVNGICPIR